MFFFLPLETMYARSKHNLGTKGFHVEILEPSVNLQFKL